VGTRAANLSALADGPRPVQTINVASFELLAERSLLKVCQTFSC
jgi:hypothetical protein